MEEREFGPFTGIVNGVLVMVAVLCAAGILYYLLLCCGVRIWGGMW